jgi:pimeloyl-ACP methyl ester carboxylesterase
LSRFVKNTAPALIFVLALMSGTSADAQTSDVWDRVEHGYADNDGVRIHYVTLGEGPLVVMVHGFPDFWYLWRDYLEALSDDYQVVAIDQRGYNQSDQPVGVDQYTFEYLVGDVAAVISAAGHESATVVGHDWGGVVAWMFAMQRPEMTDQLVVFNFPHPRTLQRELANNPQQNQNSAYARNFQQEGAHLALSAEQLAGLHGDDPVVYQRYVEGLGNSDFEGMLNYYKANYPHPPYVEDDSPVVPVQAPVLQFHGMDDPYLLPGGLNDTWELLDQDLTLVTIPGAGHWAVSDRTDFTIPMLESWLALQLAR